MLHCSGNHKHDVPDTWYFNCGKGSRGDLVFLQTPWSTFLLKSELSSGKVVNHCPLTLSCELLKIFYRLGNVQGIDSSKFWPFNHMTSAQKKIIIV